MFNFAHFERSFIPSPSVMEVATCFMHLSSTQSPCSDPKFDYQDGRVVNPHQHIGNAISAWLQQGPQGAEKSESSDFKY